VAAAAWKACIICGHYVGLIVTVLSVLTEHIRSIATFLFNRRRDDSGGGGENNSNK